MTINIEIDWETCTLDEFTHFPENFVYALYNNGTKSLLYIGGAYMESIKAEVNSKISRLSLKLENIEIAISTVENFDSACPINPKILKDAEKYFVVKYAPKLNKKIEHQSLNQKLIVKGDNLSSIVGQMAYI